MTPVPCFRFSLFLAPLEVNGIKGDVNKIYEELKKKSSVLELLVRAPVAAGLGRKRCLDMGVSFCELSRFWRFERETKRKTTILGPPRKRHTHMVSSQHREVPIQGERDSIEQRGFGHQGNTGGSKFWETARIRQRTAVAAFWEFFLSSFSARRANW